MARVKSLSTFADDAGGKVRITTCNSALLRVRATSVSKFHAVLSSRILYEIVFRHYICAKLRVACHSSDTRR